MRYTIRHKETKLFINIGEESGAWLVDDGRYGILTYKSREYAEGFLKDFSKGCGMYDEGGVVSDIMVSDDFEIVEV